MKVLRIVMNVGTSRVKDAERFYRDFLGLEAVMDLGWIATYASDEVMKPQISLRRREVQGPLFRTYRLRSMILNKHFSVQSVSVFRIEYGPVVEPWGVRRFYVRDPFSRLVNIVSHVVGEV